MFKYPLPRFHEFSIIYSFAVFPQISISLHYSFLHPLSFFTPIQPTPLHLFLSAILSFLEFAHSHCCSLLSICIPTCTSCTLTFSPQLPPAATNCSHPSLNQLLFVPSGNKAGKWPSRLSSTKVLLLRGWRAIVFILTACWKRSQVY